MSEEKGILMKDNTTFWNRNLPTNFDIGESLEVIWEVIHEWKEDLQNHEKDDRHEDVDNVHIAIWLIMEELGYDIDHGEIVLAKVEGGEG